MTNLPTWVLEFYDEPIEKASRASLKRLVSEMAKLLEKRDFATIDIILTQVDWTRLPPEIIAGIPRLSAAAEKEKNLTRWQTATKLAIDEILKKRGLTADIVFGLTDLVEDLSEIENM